MKRKMKRVSLDEGLERLPAPGGERFATVFEHGTLAVEVYAPRGTDAQQPHARDEAYIVARGSGEFVAEGERVSCEANDFLFAAAGVPHRFENFTEDFAVWVLFYGPEGGEADDARASERDDESV